MKILITGHKGFVGKHFVKFLKKDHEIVGVDIKDGIDCRDFFKYNKDSYDLIIHLAAIVGGRSTIENEPLSVATDLSIDSEMFNWAIKTNQKRIVYFSSSAAYPIHLQKRELKYKLKESDIDLNDIKNPDYTYGWTKLTGEYLAHFAKKQGIKVHIFRPFSGYGEDQDLTYPFPSFIKRIVDKKDPFEIWGDGEQVRDFVYIDDIVECVMKCVEYDYIEPLNIGNGIPYTFNEFAEILFKMEGWRPSKGVNHIITAPSGVDYRCCDPSNMLKIYTPKYNFEDGIRLAINHFKNI